MTHVFVSFSTDDSDFAHRISQALMRADFRVTVSMDATDPPPESYKFRDTRFDKLRDCDVLVCVLSHASLQSATIWSEIQIAEAARKPIIPIMIESMAYPDTLLRCYRTIDFTHFEFHEAFRGLVDQIQAIGSYNAHLLQQHILNRIQQIDLEVRADPRAQRLAALIRFRLLDDSHDDIRHESPDTLLADRLGISERFAQALLKATFPVDELDELFIDELAEALECDPRLIRDALSDFNPVSWHKPRHAQRPDVHKKPSS